MRIGIVRNFAAEMLVDTFSSRLQAYGMQVEIVFSGYGLETDGSTHETGAFEQVDYVLVLLDLEWELDKRQLIGEGRGQGLAEVEREVVREYLQFALVRLNIPKTTRIICLVFGQGLTRTPSYDRREPRSEVAQGDKAQATETLLPEFDIEFLATNEVAYRFGAESLFDNRLRFSVSMPFTQKGLTEFSRLIAERLLFLEGRGVKCVVVDLDNTLWGGILDEVGPEGLALGQTIEGAPYVWFQRQLKRLAEQGVQLAVASKNDEMDVRQVMDSHPSMMLVASDFETMQVNWKDKASQISQIALNLNLSPQNILFIDDSEREIRLVQSHHPEIHVLKVEPDRPSSIYSFFWQIPPLEVRTYRSSARQAAGISRESGAHSIARAPRVVQDSILTIRSASSWDLARLEELARRTNQFNSDGIRTSRAEFAHWLNDDGVQVRVCSLEDDVGDLGIVGFAVFARGKDGVVTVMKMALSCRAFGYGIEFAMLTDSEMILQRTPEFEVTELIIQFTDTGRNGRFLDFVRNLTRRDSRSPEAPAVVDVKWASELAQEQRVVVSIEPSV